MEATVTELLREFPRLRRAALAGERVIIKSREGDLQLTRDTTKPASLLGAMQGQIVHSGLSNSFSVKDGLDDVVGCSG
jgi:hypothetical protein